MAPSSWHERLYRALLRLFPAEFRGDFGDEMADDFRQQRLDAATGGTAPVARLWTRTALDMGRRAPLEHLDVLRRDAAYAVRLLLRRPGFAVITLATLALGIGLNTAVFSVVSAILLRPLPIPESARLVRLFEVSPPPEREPGDVSSSNFLDWQAQTRTLDAVTLIGRPAGDAHRLRRCRTDSRDDREPGLRPRDERASRRSAACSRQRTTRHWRRNSSSRRSSDKTVEPNVVVLGHDLWQRRFGGRPGHRRQHRAPGRPERRSRRRDAAGFRVHRRSLSGATRTAGCPRLPIPSSGAPGCSAVVGRLAPGRSLAQAQAEFDIIASQLADKYPRANKDRGIRLSPLLQAQTAAVRVELWLLLGAAACVLLIGCANVANLLLAHASGRRLELATRLALGATRAHLVRQTLTESLLISLAGGAAGFALAIWALPTLVALAPPETPRLNEISVDWRMLAFAAVASVVVGLACGLAVVLSMDRVNPQARWTPSVRRGRRASRPPLPPWPHRRGDCARR